MPLFLLPNLLDPEGNPDLFFPALLKEKVLSLQGLIAESEKAGRAYLKLFSIKPQGFPILLLNEHTQKIEEEMLQKIKEEMWGLISDAGLPCLADPGANLVKKARECNIPITTFSGPSSIIMALQLSGLSGQQFAFHGYISRERTSDLKEWEKRAKKGETQIFIETPYRNEETLKAILSTLDEKTTLCVAWDLTMKSETVLTANIKKWRSSALPCLHKHPAIFLFS